MLDPFAEIGIGMFVTIVVGRRQRVMDVLRHGKRRNGEQEKDQADPHSAPNHIRQTYYGRT
jgi:ribosomal 50S subunit-recycling heat shock protein